MASDDRSDKAEIGMVPEVANPGIVRVRSKPVGSEVKLRRE
jgi:hypothetical protein